MSDQPTPPPKPKPGSLRDRIAAFEKPAGGPAPGPPLPRPKPGGISWKPKVPSPPSSPSGKEASGPAERRVGMSASDAMESIGKGGSLKERMAALQNRGGFGAPPPTAPKPALEKPRWKPPPVIAPVDKDDDLPRGESSKSPPTHSVPPAEEESSSKEAVEEEASARAEPEQSVENDDEEEERQRRAAIAARMARLGGARLGVAPVFGKPEVKKPESKEEIAPSEAETENITAETTKDGKSDLFLCPSLPISKPM